MNLQVSVDQTNFPEVAIFVDFHIEMIEQQIEPFLNSVGFSIQLMVLVDDKNVEKGYLLFSTESSVGECCYHRRLKFGSSIILKYLNKNMIFKDMTRCETSRLGAIPCLVSCLPQRMLGGNVKPFDVIFKKMKEETTRAVELA